MLVSRTKGPCRTTTWVSSDADAGPTLPKAKMIDRSTVCHEGVDGVTESNNDRKRRRGSQLFALIRIALCGVRTHTLHGRMTASKLQVNLY
jgi:hypothetical protein